MSPQAEKLKASDDVIFCGWTLKRGTFFWAPHYFALTKHSELLWYEGGEAELKKAGTLDLLQISAITRDKPDSDKNFSFRVVTPAVTVRLDPGSKEAFDKWQASLVRNAQVAVGGGRDRDGLRARARSSTSRARRARALRSLPGAGLAAWAHWTPFCHLQEGLMMAVAQHSTHS